jgi:regulator of protease activity HflC (stomatin/prohibitin superfamily)
MKKYLKLLVIGALAAVAVGCSKVPAGYTGVVVNMMGSEKGVDLKEEPTGYKFLTPNEELFLFPTFNQNFNITGITAQDKDGLKLEFPIGVTLRAQEGSAPLLFKTYRKGMDEIVQVNVPQVIRNAINNSASKKSAEVIYGPGKEAFIKDVETSVKEYFAARGIIVESLYLNGLVGLPPQVVDAINAKIKATQTAMQRENELRQTQAEAEKVREEARGKADAALTVAKAEAEALRIRGTALRENPGVVELNAIEKWDGKLPTYNGGGAVPFLNIR